MNYCCRGIASCCQGIGKCCSNCCNTCCKCVSDCCECVSKCCNDACQGICDCIHGLCSSIQQFFSTPFSFCTFISVFLVGVPFVLMLTVLFNNKYSNKCDQPIGAFMIVEGINNFINVIFCIYLMCAFKKGYQSRVDMFSGEVIEEHDIYDKIQNMILYDCIVFIYIILLVFFFIWTIIGSVWLTNEITCTTSNTYMISISKYNIIAMYVYLIGGLITFLAIFCTKSMEEGSCNCINVCICFICCCTCGIIDCRKHKKKSQPIQNKNQNEPQPQQSKGLVMMNNLINIFNQQQNPQILQQQPQNQQPQQYPIMIQPQQIQQQQYPVQQQQYPAQYQQYQPQQNVQGIQIHEAQLQKPNKPQEQKGLFDNIKDKVTGIFGKK